MQAATFEVTGKLLTLTSADYDFEDRETHERRQGVSMRAYVLPTMPGAVPLEIRVPERLADRFGVLEALPPGADVGLVVKVRAVRDGQQADMRVELSEVTAY